MSRHREEVIIAALDLAVFMLVVSSIGYVTQHSMNPEIGDFLDALYFTVTTLSTTGFGDITSQQLGTLCDEHVLRLARLSVPWPAAPQGYHIRAPVASVLGRTA